MTSTVPRPASDRRRVLERRIRWIVTAGFAIREGIEAWRGDACATSIGMLLEDERHDDDDDHEGHRR